MRSSPKRLAIALVLALVASLSVAPAALALDSSEADPTAPLLAVVKLAPGVDVDPDALADRFDAAHVEPVIASRGVYAVHSEHTVSIDDKGKLKVESEGKHWLKDVEDDAGVLWAELDVDVSVDDSRFHVWRFHVWQFNASSGMRGLPQVEAGPTQPAFASLDVAEAHHYATGDGVLVAILDSGVDSSHPLLSGRVIAEYDLVDDDPWANEEANGIDDDHDGLIDEAYGHGTFVAGVVAQLAPSAQIYALRVIDDDGTGEIFALVEAIDMAIEMDVDVINMSFGVTTPDKIKLLEAALKRAKEAGVLIVGAAGNAGDDRKSYPASDKNVVSVAASGDTEEDLADFSSRGKWVRLAAPGVRVVSAAPGGGYVEWTGTSMATPVVSALAALLIEANPKDDFKVKDITNALYKGARKMRDKEQTEKGIVDIIASLEELLGDDFGLISNN